METQTDFKNEAFLKAFEPYADVPMEKLLNGIARTAAEEALEGRENPFSGLTEYELDHLGRALSFALRERPAVVRHKTLVELYGMTQLEEWRRTDWEAITQDKIRAGAANDSDTEEEEP